MASWRWEGVTGPSDVCGHYGRDDSHQPLERRALSLNGRLLQEVSDYGAPNLQVRAAFHRRQRRYRILVDDQVIDRQAASPGDGAVP